MLTSTAINANSIKIMLEKSKLSFKFLAADYKIAVQRFNAEEKISDIYEVNLWLVSEDKIHFNNVIQSEGLFTIAGKNKDRYFHGIISHFTLNGKGDRFFFYQACLVPYFWCLSLDKDFRSFQDMTTEEIVTEVLEENNILSDSYDFRLVNEYQKRRYCTQYGESDLHFVSRLLEEEGIFYFFEHSKDKHLQVFSDDEQAYLEIPGDKTIHMHHDSGMTTDKEVIDNFSYVRSIRPGMVTQTNYNFKRPSLSLKVNMEGNTHNDYEVYEYPGPYGYPDEGEITAQIRLQEKKTMEEAAQGSSNCVRFIPGHIFQIACHDFGDLNKDYMLVSVRHRGSQLHVTGEYSGIGGGYNYDNEFTAVPASVIIRPEKIHKKPVVQGLQPAVVVGPKGEEIHVDEFCRVKVQFPWDRNGQNDEKSSCWVRVVQSWGGGGYGAINIPRIGDEVVIAFLNGDPDWPILVGSVYNAANMPINNLKQSVTQTGIKTKTHKGEGFHELRFDDAKGSEEIFLHSQKDWNIIVRDSKGQAVGGNKYSYVKGIQTEIAKEMNLAAYEKITIVSGASSIIITPEGIKINGPRVDINDGSSAPMPKEQPVSGSTGGGGGGVKQSASGPDNGADDAKPAVNPQPQPTPEPGPAKPDDLAVKAMDEVPPPKSDITQTPALITPLGVAAPTSFAAAKPSVEDANALETTDIIESHKNAKAMIDKTVKCLEDAKTQPNSLLGKYFGIDGNTEEGKAKIDTLIGNYKKMGSKMESIGYEVEHEPITPGEPYTLAYVYKMPVIRGVGDVHTVYPAFNTISQDEKAATIVHEMSHYEVGTEDHAYEWETDKWNKLTPDQQMDNADTYSKFAMDCSAGIK
jgi:type VI secretion system secreted protein VgrG